MKIITQKFNEISKTIINSLKNKEIKSIIGRVRLKFTYKEINDYVQIIFAHSQTQKSFKSIYKRSKFKNKDSCFMSNIQLFSKLISKDIFFPFMLFYQLSRNAPFFRTGL